MDAAIVLSRYNLTFANVLQDCSKQTTKSCLTSNQPDDIFNRISYPEASLCADHYVSNLPTVKRAAVIDVAFSGCAKLNNVTKMKAALEKKEWNKAADELRNSKWWNQVHLSRRESDYRCIAGSN
ncbi:unnamed protein product [Rotaria sp. Silwood1]|nr:unnamed protein product [Rotaria sp. Silwood1]CAF3651653.1 unnamed protein product [Rotaria sp. Silwood1]CAF3674511.1 unnamed protein product [Rotaria sp. Silwood1]CAF4963142.1 unnamed protein product [Rotaria sp. Silwood1]CAF4992638.1 unnamed protein product [Rotaria sp. Silwood1]